MRASFVASVQTILRPLGYEVGWPTDDHGSQVVVRALRTEYASPSFAFHPVQFLPNFRTCSTLPGTSRILSASSTYGSLRFACTGCTRTLDVARCPVNMAVPCFYLVFSRATPNCRYLSGTSTHRASLMGIDAAGNLLPSPINSTPRVEMVGSDRMLCTKSLRQSAYWFPIHLVEQLLVIGEYRSVASLNCFLTSHFPP
jgi:hypothetical protein